VSNKRIRFVLLAVVMAMPLRAAGAETISLRTGGWTIRVDPATLRVEAVSDVGTSVLVSDGQPGLGPAKILEQDGASAHWTLASRGLTARIRIEGNDITIGLQSDRVGKLTWPVVVPGKNVDALILPRGEGNWVPVEDADWMRDLAGDPENANAVNEEFSLPCWGLALRGGTFTCILPNPFNSELTYLSRDGRLGFRIVHAFTRLDREKVYGCVVRIGGPSPVEPARQYRAWLVQQGGFVSMADKIKQTPRAERLPGALQAYLWGLPFEAGDVKDWDGFMRRLTELPGAAADSPSAHLWSRLPPAGQKAVRNLLASEWKDEYSKSEVTRAFSGLISRGGLTPEQMMEVFPAQFAPASDWGGGISVRFLKMLSAAGIDRACLTLGDLNSGDGKPEVARAAEAMGYLYAPYDSYDSVHRPGQVDTSDTAQFDAELFKTGGIMRADGTLAAGFGGKGRWLSSRAARPWVEKRVGGKMAAIPFSAWFVDCDAAGQWFDDYSPAHPGTQAQDVAARIDRMRWIARTYGLPVGSEGGSALAAGAVHYGHGVLTPAIGAWDDPDLENEKSKFNLGGWWPPECPEVFFKRVPIKPKYLRRFCDPRFRLPLYQVVFHDSVITTHHWGTPSLKFKDTLATTALLEQLYNVPPLYHLTVDEFTKQRERVVAHYRFFSPLHRRLATRAMTDFRWLSDDRLVQKTVFTDGTEVIANFGKTPVDVEGSQVPAGTVVSRWNAETASYTPADK